MSNHKAIRFTEKVIVQKTIAHLLAQGYVIGVHDGQEITLRASRDAQQIFEHMFTSDIASMLVRHSLLDRSHFGWVHFVYGNGGWDVLADYSLNLDSALKQVNKFVDSLDGPLQPQLLQCDAERDLLIEALDDYISNKKDEQAFASQVAIAVRLLERLQLSNLADVSI